MSMVTEQFDAVVASRGAHPGLWAPPSQRGIQRVLKRGMDVVIAAIALIVLAVPMLLIALAIKLESRGPAILSQRRIKMNGEPFVMHKFRTMRYDAEGLLRSLAAENEHSGPIFKMKNDPRRTRVGVVLRKTSLDELPNLFDVLLGHMSLVGPRPPLPHEVAEYTALDVRRLSVKPGMTGLWQIHGRSLLSFDEMVDLDIAYIEDWTLWRDLSILLRTLPAVVSARGAY